MLSNTNLSYLAWDVSQVYQTAEPVDLREPSPPDPTQLVWDRDASFTGRICSVMRSVSESKRENVHPVVTMKRLWKSERSRSCK